jgi:Uma2 family endonuclease
MVQGAALWLAGLGLACGDDSTPGGTTFSSTSGSSDSTEVKLRVAPQRGRKADVVVFMPGSTPPPRRGLLGQPPDLVVEVVTPTPRDERRDRVEKMDEYAAFGVRFYWIVDPALGRLEIFQLTEDRKYAKAIGMTSGRIDDVPGCPDLDVDLDELWRELDRLGPVSR